VTTYQVVYAAATLLCSLVAGFLLAFAAVVMPGLRNLDDAGFIRAFQQIDGVIQNNQPLFVIMWVGSVVTLIAAAVAGIWALDGVDRLLVIAAALVYLLGVQLPTAAINIPLNNRLKKLDSAALNDALRQAREAFEPRWNRWNVFRTVCASLTVIMLVLGLLRV
jgi:uncharacterized membrane protein